MILFKKLINHNKAYLSMGLYLLGITLCFVNPMLGAICYIVVAILWIVPNKRVEEFVD